jgi:hypothetical protein
MKRPELHTRCLRLVCVKGNTLCVSVHRISSTLVHRPNRIRPPSPQPHVPADSHPTNTCAPENNDILTRLSIACQHRIRAVTDWGRGQAPPQDRSAHQMTRDQHIHSTGDQKFRREQWDNTGGVGQVRKAEHRHHTEPLNHHHAYQQGTENLSTNGWEVWRLSYPGVRARAGLAPLPPGGGQRISRREVRNSRAPAIAKVTYGEEAGGIPRAYGWIRTP